MRIRSLWHGSHGADGVDRAYVGRTTTDIAGPTTDLDLGEQVTRMERSNRNYVPDCDLRTSRQTASRRDPDPKSQENIKRVLDEALPVGCAITLGTSVEVQHQLGANMSVSAGYYRNGTATSSHDNIA